MKNYYCLLTGLFFLVISSKTIAQNTKNYVGVKAGISIPNLTANGSDKNPINTGYSSRLGPDFAAFFEIPITKTFSLMPTLEYSSQGGKKDGFQAFNTPDQYAAYFPPGQAPPYLYANYKSEAKLNYLILGIPGKFNWTPGSRSSAFFYIDAGPFVAVLISAHQATSGSSMIYADEQMQQPLTQGPQSFDNTEDIKNDLRNGNIGIEGDLGVAVPVKKGRIFLEAGGNYGFVNIQKGKENGKNQTGAASIRVGYSIGLVKKHRTARS